MSQKNKAQWDVQEEKKATDENKLKSNTKTNEGENTKKQARETELHMRDPLPRKNKTALKAIYETEHPAALAAQKIT